MPFFIWDIQSKSTPKNQHIYDYKEEVEHWVGGAARNLPLDEDIHTEYGQPW